MEWRILENKTEENHSKRIEKITNLIFLCCILQMHTPPPPSLQLCAFCCMLEHAHLQCCCISLLFANCIMKLQMLAMQECSPSTHFIRRHRHRRRRTYEDTHSLVHRKQQKKLCREFELRREIENMQHSSFRTQYNNSNECAA